MSFISVNFDEMGPFNFNDELKEFILKNGISGTIISRPDLKNPEWGEDICLLHIPTGKTSSYTSYFNMENKYIHIFNGLWMAPIKNSADTFMYVYNEEIRSKFGRK